MRARTAFWIWVAFVGLLADMGPVQEIRSHWGLHRTPSWQGMYSWEANGHGPVCDQDTRLIHDGLLMAPRFRDTGRWWVGTWAGQVTFYRPIPSMLFWAEWKLFGDHEVGYLLASPLLHFAALLLFARMALLLLEGRGPPGRAELAAGLMTGLFGDGLWILPSRWAIVVENVGAWKNQPDLLCTLFFCAGLCCYLVARRTTGISGQRGIGAALVLYLAACSSKEIGVFLPLLLPWIEMDALGRVATRPAALRRLAVLLAALPLFLLFRSAALHTATGFVYGSNQSWTYRLGLGAFGPLSALLQSGGNLAAALGIVAFALAAVVRLRREAGKPWSLGLAIFACVTALVLLALFGDMQVQGGVQNPGGPLVRGLTDLILYGQQAVALGGAAVALFLLGFWMAARRSMWIVGLGLTWNLAGLGLTLLSPGPLHRFYLVDGGYAVVVGAGLAALFSPAVPMVRADDAGELAPIPTAV